MLRQPKWTPKDHGFASDLLAAHPWAMLVSQTDDGPVVSHLPVVEEGNPGAPMVVLGHLPKADADAHCLGSRDALLVVQGPHGYVSPGWFDQPGYVPTWDYTTVHLTGRPELLDDDEALDVLHATVDMLEAPRDTPWRMDDEVTGARDMLPHIVAFRFRTTSVAAKAKLGQTRPEWMTDQVLRGLESDSCYANAALAEAIRASQGRT